MRVSKRHAVLLAAVAVSVSAFATVQASHAEAPQAVGVARVDDFVLADQNLLARQLYRMSDDKAVVLLTYASGDAALHADAKALMALKAAYAGRGVDVLAVDSRIGDRRDPVVADAKAAGIDMPILFDYEQLVGEALGVTRAAEVIVIDPRGWTIAYRGPVAGAKAAVDALVAGQKVAMTSVPAKGQLIAFPERAKARPSPRSPTPAPSPRSSRPSAPGATSPAGSGRCRSTTTSRSRASRR